MGVIRVSNSLSSKLKEEAGKTGVSIAQLVESGLREDKPVTAIKTVELHPSDLCSKCQDLITEKLLPGVTIKMKQEEEEEEQPSQSSWWGVTSEEPQPTKGYNWGWIVMALLLYVWTKKS